MFTKSSVYELEETNDKMSLIDHLQELRKRLIICIVSVGITSLGCYYYSVDLVHFVTLPAGKLYYMNPSEALFTYLRISVFGGFLVSVPIIVYQIWAFVAPALSNQERRLFRFLMPVVVILFFLGLLFSYYLVLPVGVRFFLGFSSDELQPLFSIAQYVSFVIDSLLPFGFIFELPLIIIAATQIGLVNSQFLISKRKIIIVLSFIIGAVIAPNPDVISQCMVAIPLIVLYEASLLIVKYMLRN